MKLTMCSLRVTQQNNMIMANYDWVILEELSDLDEERLAVLNHIMIQKCESPECTTRRWSIRYLMKGSWYGRLSYHLAKMTISMENGRWIGKILSLSIKYCKEELTYSTTVMVNRISDRLMRNTLRSIIRPCGSHSIPLHHLSDKYPMGKETNIGQVWVCNQSMTKEG